MSFDPVTKPKHYNTYQVEVIDVIQEMLTNEEFKGYLKGNLLKYRLRAGLKFNRDEDLGKSNWYQDRLQELEELDGDTDYATDQPRPEIIVHHSTYSPT